MPEIEFFEVLGLLGQGEQFALDIMGALLRECLSEKFGVCENVFVRIFGLWLHI